eukprot:TRINITY_DN19046_c0_g1_i1.p1 TRINITY_DN19046_c0_g1~~TRINITY_DN19046_c0_g1_i1.p1  ORF type:complete len:432 (+),score=88.61 TRINITY_DN19046_c0_g1_i1:100-1395(+)
MMRVVRIALQGSPHLYTAARLSRAAAGLLQRRHLRVDNTSEGPAGLRDGSLFRCTDEEAAQFLRNSLGEPRDLRRVLANYTLKTARFKKLVKLRARLSRDWQASLGPLSYEYILCFCASLRLHEYAIDVLADMHEGGVKVTAIGWAYVLYLEVAAGNDPTKLFAFLDQRGVQIPWVGQHALLRYWASTGEFDKALKFFQSLDNPRSLTCCIFLRCCRSVREAKQWSHKLPISKMHRERGHLGMALLYVACDKGTPQEAYQILCKVRHPVPKHFNIVALSYLMKERNWRAVMTTMKMLQERGRVFDDRSISIIFSALALRAAEGVAAGDRGGVDVAVRQAQSLFLQSMDQFSQSQTMYGGMLEVCAATGDLDMANKIRGQQRTAQVKESSRFLELFAQCEAAASLQGKRGLVAEVRQRTEQPEQGVGGLPDD